jgi:hypothetical protein
MEPRIILMCPEVRDWAAVAYELEILTIRNFEPGNVELRHMDIMGKVLVIPSEVVAGLA